MDIDEILKQKAESDRLHQESLEAIRKRFAPKEEKPRTPQKEKKSAKNKEQLKYALILLGLFILGMLVLYWLS